MRICFVVTSAQTMGLGRGKAMERGKATPRQVQMTTEHRAGDRLSGWGNCR